MDMGGSRQQQPQQRRRRGSPAAGRPRTVPIAVTPEGFWCCPSPAALHKSLVKNPHHHHHPHAKHAPAPPTHKTPSAPPSRAPSVQTAPSVPDDDPAPAVPDEHHQQSQATAEVPAPAPAPADEQQEAEAPPPPHKVCVGFGRTETSDLTVMLYGKEGIAVRMSVHSDVLSQSSAFFAHRLAAIAAASSSPAPNPPCVLEIHDCDDAEIYVETVGLMYCDEAKHRLLLKQSVPRVLRIMKAADAIGFHACVTSCLRYLEAVPWVGDDEERSVVSSVRRLQSKHKDKDDGGGGGGCIYGGVVAPLLKRIASDDNDLRPPSDTFASITEMVLTSTDDRGRREMKALVLNLLKDSSRSRSHGGGGGEGSPPPDDISSAETLYGSCRGCLDRLQRLFADASSAASESDYYSPAAVTRRIALETDNLLWLVELLASQRAGDGLVALWSGQAELAASHAGVPAASRHAVSRVTARLFVGVGRGELLPPRDARLRLLQVWLQPLIDDYAWLQRGGGGGNRPSASAPAAFDRRLVEDGIGQTILTLPLEDQRSILLAWFGRFLKLGDDCPNLQRAFEVWWRRTFVRPYVHLHQTDSDADDVCHDVLPSDRGSS